MSTASLPHEAPRGVPRPALVAACALAAAAFGSAAFGSAAFAQEMEPRAYSSSPVGMNFLSLSAGNTRGGILFDASVPITDASADLNLGVMGYARTFALAGKQGLAGAGVSYARGDLEGVVGGGQQRTGRSGLTDMRAKISINLLGPGVLTPEEFAAAPKRTIFGVSLTIQPPTGQYDETRLINIGTNRWSFKPEVGVSVPVRRWFLDFYAGAWLYTANDSFYPGDSTRRQDPLYSAQGHASYTFKTRAWLAFDVTSYGGGDATVDDGPPSTRQNTTRVGATGSIPLTRRQSIKIAASTGASARVGSDFNTGLIGWQFGWLDRPVTAHP
jgi:outer membrane putative beta-barrel porin/alpha-amylase